MNNHFMHIVESAAANKQLFDCSMGELKGSLERSVKVSAKSSLDEAFPSMVPTTGWLRGSLSYPWVVVCFIIPAVLETIM